MGSGFTMCPFINRCHTSRLGRLYLRQRLSFAGSASGVHRIQGPASQAKWRPDRWRLHSGRATPQHREWRYGGTLLMMLCVSRSGPLSFVRLSFAGVVALVQYETARGLSPRVLDDYNKALPGLMRGLKRWHNWTGLFSSIFGRFLSPSFRVLDSVS